MKYQIIHGDCLEELASLPADSVDAIVTDPPYHLYSIVKRFGKEGSAPAQYGTDGAFGRVSKGFMGKEWDGGDISYRPETWTACLRVLKPGGHMLCFGGSRTFHRIAVAIEDAGFELRDTVMWVYGCLSEDTEILTIDGWVRFDSPTLNSPVVCYNSINGAFEAHIATRRYVYDNKHTAYHIKSNLTDQIVSRNHRVAVEREGKIIFEYAENLREMENIPFLESLHGLPETIYDFHKGTSIKKQDLLERVQRQADFLAKEWQREACGAKGLYPDNLCSMRETGMEARFRPSEGSFANMQLPLQRGVEGQGLEATRLQGQGCVESSVGAEIERENDGPFKSSVEGRSNIFQTARKLCWGKICQMPSRIFTYGKERWLRNGASANSGDANRAVAVEGGSCASCQPSALGQQAGEPNAIFKQPASQNVRVEGQPATTLATITPVEYRGKVWCVEVPTGAFVARRNGQIFITGNSGFPKSHDVSKAIDKAAGAERTDGQREWRGGKRPNNSFGGGSNQENGTATLIKYDTPATDAAKQWQGWGTALKPAYEPIIVCYKGLTISNIISILLLEITDLLEVFICQQRLNVNVTDVEKHFSLFRQRLEGVGANSVAESAKTLSLEEIARVVFAEKNTILQGLTQIGAKENFALTSARENFRNSYQENATQIGEAEDILVQVDTFMLDIMGHTSGNIALLWNNILEEVLLETNKYTTLTVIRLITELKTLKLFLQQSTSKDIGNSSLKPAFEPIILARKPMEGTVAGNVLKWGTGAINVDGCRVDWDALSLCNDTKRRKTARVNIKGGSFHAGGGKQGEYFGEIESPPGRWPANFIHDGSEEVLKLFPTTSPTKPHGGDEKPLDTRDMGWGFKRMPSTLEDDGGSAARYFYCAKASKKDRDEGCEGLEEKQYSHDGRETTIENAYQRNNSKAHNHHPTVKPTSLMRYLCKLITPPNGTILDPFMGSGSTGKAAMLEGFNFIGIEREQEYVEIAEARIEYARKNRGDILDDDIRDETDGDPTLFNCA